MSPSRLTADASNLTTGQGIVGGRDAEPRSWKPSGYLQMKMSPMPAKPTNRDLGDRLVQVHDCVEKHQKSNLAHFKTLTEDMAKVKAVVEKPTAGTSTPWQAWRRTLFATTTSVTSVAVIYKIALAAGPGIWEAIKGLMHAAAHGLI